MHNALPMVDTWDHYSTGDITTKWTFQNGASIVPTGRTGKGLFLPNLATVYRTFTLEYPTISCGIAMRYETILPSGDMIAFRNFPYATTCSLTGLGDGRIVCISHHGSSTRTTSPGEVVLASNTWYYVELSVTNAANTTSFKVRINEEQILNEVVAGLGAAADNNLATIQIYGQNPGSATVDDFWASDTGLFFGDLRGIGGAGVIYPDGVGDSAMWALHGAPTNYQAVNEHSPDYLTTYVSTSSVNDLDLHTMENVSPLSDIVFVQGLCLEQKTDAGSASTAMQWKSGVTTYASPDFYPSNQNWQYDRDCLVLSPFTGLPWTDTEIDGMQFGYKRLT
jgi:hypothetical protein